MRRLDFEHMTFGDVQDALSYLMTSGQIDADEAVDLTVTVLLAIGGRSREALDHMPAGDWYRSLGQVEQSLRPAGRIEEADRYRHVINILQRFEGKPWQVDTTA